MKKAKKKSRKMARKINKREVKKSNKRKIKELSKKPKKFSFDLRVIIFIIVVIVVLILLINPNKNTAQKAVTEIIVTACEKAEEGGTCFTRLPQLGIISPEECCERYGKCCEGD